MKPALSAEEWAAFLPGRVMELEFRADDVVTFTTMDDVGRDTRLSGSHALAAMCLYGQPFGFERKHVHYLRLFARDFNLPELYPIADRIEALLPPETEE